MGLLSEDFEPVVYVPDVKIMMLSPSTRQFGEILKHLLKNTRIYNYNMSTVLHACQCAWYYMQHRGQLRLQNLNMDDPIRSPNYEAPMEILFSAQNEFIKDISQAYIMEKTPTCTISIYLKFDDDSHGGVIVQFGILPTLDVDSNFLNQPFKRIDYEPIERTFCSKKR